MFPIRTLIRYISLHKLPRGTHGNQALASLGVGQILAGFVHQRDKIGSAEKISLEELLEKHCIPAGEVGMVAVNGCLAQKDLTLNDQDDVHLYPPLAGG